MGPDGHNWKPQTVCSLPAPKKKLSLHSSASWSILMLTKGCLTQALAKPFQNSFPTEHQWQILSRKEWLSRKGIVASQVRRFIFTFFFWDRKMLKIRNGFIDVSSSSFLDTHFCFTNYVQSTQYTQRQSQQQWGTGQRPGELFSVISTQGKTGFLILFEKRISGQVRLKQDWSLLRNFSRDLSTGVREALKGSLRHTQGWDWDSQGRLVL